MTTDDDRVVDFARELWASWPPSQPWQGKRVAGVWYVTPDPGDLGALVCAVDVPQNRRPGSYFWNSRGERVARMTASPPRGARHRRLRVPG